MSKQEIPHNFISMNVFNYTYKRTIHKLHNDIHICVNADEKICCKFFMQTTFYENLILILQFKMFILQFNLSSWFFFLFFNSRTRVYFSANLINT